MKPCSNISLHFHDNSSLSTSEGTCLYCKQTSLGNWPVFFLYLIFHLFKGFASKRSRLQVCTFSFLTPLPFCFWKRSILEIKILSACDFNNLTEQGWVPVCTCVYLGTNIRNLSTYSLVPFQHKSLGNRKLTNTFFEKERKKLFRASLKSIRNKIVVVCSFFFFFPQDLSLKTKVPIIEIVLWQN